MVRFGLLQLFEAPGDRTMKQYFEENIALVDHAEAVGLDEIWLAEHHFSEYGVMPSTQVFASYIAARTERIRIGSAVVVLPFHNPIRVAEEFGLIDVLSGGRLDFGIGRGYQPAEFRGYGIPIESSRDRFNEAEAIIKQAWTQESVNFEGKYYQFENVKPRPKPLQQPHPPLFGASLNPETIKYQAMKKMNLLFSPLFAPPAALSEYWSILEQQGEDRASYRVGGLVFCYLDEDREKALHDFEQPCMWYFRTIAKHIPAKAYPAGEDFFKNYHGSLTAMLEAYDRKQLSFAEIVENEPFGQGFLVGDPEQVSAKLETLLARYRGISDILCWTRLGGLDHHKVMHSMELLVDKVARPLREKGGSSLA